MAGICGVYSFRKLKSTAIKCIRVRRSSDNAEMDIVFSGTNLDTVSLLDFVGSGNAYISKWYDQSGVNNDLIQITASKQLEIVKTGVLNTLNGRTNARLYGSEYLVTSGFSSLDSGSAWSCNVVAKANSSSSVILVSTNATKDLRIQSSSGNSYSALSTNLAYFNEDRQTLTSDFAIWDGSKTGNAERLKMYRNGVKKTLTFSGTIPATTGVTGELILGAYNDIGSNAWIGYVSEVIVSASPLNDYRRKVIERNQIKYFGV